MTRCRAAGGNDILRGEDGADTLEGGSAQVDGGVAVFVDSNGDRLADLSFVLANANIADVAGNLFV